MPLPSNQTPMIRAVRKLSGWLRASGMPTARAKLAGAHIEVKTRHGKSINITLVPRQAISVVHGERAFLAQDKLVSNDQAEALGVFHMVTQHAGFGVPSPISRGPVPTRRANHHTDFDSIALRHKELHRAPNPPAEELRQYQRTISIACANFLARNRSLCQEYQLEQEDLQTYAMTWTISFMSHTEIPLQMALKKDENQKLLMVALKRRFLDLYGVLTKKRRSVNVSRETYHIAVHGRCFDDNHMVEAYAHNPIGQLDLERDSDGQPREVPLAYTQRRNQLDTDGHHSRRRKSAAELLKSMLAKLPHDRLVEVLTEQSQQSEFRDPDAALEAARRLRAHVAGCASCQAGRAAQADEQHAAVNAARTAE